MKVEYVQNLDDEDIKKQCAFGLADIWSKYVAAKDCKDTRTMRWYAKDFQAVSNFLYQTLGWTFRDDSHEGIVWDITGREEHDLGSIEGYSKMLAELRGAEICPFCGSLLGNSEEGEKG